MRLHCLPVSYELLDWKVTHSACTRSRFSRSLFRGPLPVPALASVNFCAEKGDSQTMAEGLLCGIFLGLECWELG